MAKLLKSKIFMERYPKRVISGYRFFKCPECNHEWAEKMRDCYTPSLTICPNIIDGELCAEETFPHGRKEDEQCLDKSDK